MCGRRLRQCGRRLGEQECLQLPLYAWVTPGNAPPGINIPPATWQVTATMTWRACWVAGVVDRPPPANCRPVPGATLNGLTWTRAVTVNEIQSVDNGNGNG